MNSLRTKKEYERYKKYLDEYIRSGSSDCILCNKEPLRSFKYWKIVKNDFPYDRIAKRHDMIIPIRHTTEEGLTEEEKEEFIQIKRNELQGYDSLLEATDDIKSIPQHFHIHLLKIKDFPT